jgi:putative flippase GtrA
MSVLWFTLTIAGAAFNLAQASAAVAAMTSNFFMNNLFTYRDRRLRGLALVRGLFTFYTICALGAVANVGIAGYVFSRNEAWWLAGLAGVVVGSVWNYAVSSVFTWKQRSRLQVKSRSGRTRGVIIRSHSFPGTSISRGGSVKIPRFLTIKSLKPFMLIGEISSAQRQRCALTKTKSDFDDREAINLCFCRRRHSVACGACCHRCQMKPTMAFAGARIRGMLDQQ